MPDRAGKFVSAIVVSALAGASLAAVSHNAARAADDCLAAPKGETPEGSHWYYRIERGTKHHCWYLRAEGEKLSQTAQPNSSTTATPAAAIARPPMQRAVADAHAELPAQTSVQPQPIRKDGPFPPMPADPTLNQGTAAASQAAGADAPPSVVASRWPDSSAANSTVSPPTAAEQLAANVPPGPASDSSHSDSSRSDSTQTDSSQPDPAAASPAAAVPLAAADSSQDGLPASMRMLLAVMTGALALAGITASLVLKFAGARRASRVRVSRDQIWEPVDNRTVRLPYRSDADVVPRRPLPRDLDEAREPNDRVADFYAQISKQRSG
jgi:hypothetical protein